MSHVMEQWAADTCRFTRAIWPQSKGRRSHVCGVSCCREARPHCLIGGAIACSGC